MAKQHKLNKEDVVEILASVIGEMRQAGLRVGLAPAPATEKRQEGILIFVEGVSLNNEGLMVMEQAKA